MTVIFQDAPADSATPGALAAAAQMPAPHVRLRVHRDLAAVEETWRRFQSQADCTVFQTFDWLIAWYRHIGIRNTVAPAIVVGSDAGGEMLFLMPLAVHPGAVRRLKWLGHDLCDYNAPLLAPDFSQRITPDHFLKLWDNIRDLIQNDPALRHDIVDLGKMPETVGAQPNPFLHLPVGLNPSGAHLMHLAGTWEEFYTARRSSATRRRDRTKRKRLGEMGEVRFVNPHGANDVAKTLDILVVQKSQAFAEMGVANLFARPGYRDFFFGIATDPATRDLVHVSRLDVGQTVAATNLGLQFRGCYYHILASYDGGDVSRFGPGAAHLRDLMQRASERGCDRFDFTIGDERYKLEWSDTLVKLYDHTVAASPRGWPVVFAADVARRAKRGIKQNPILWQAFSRVRAAVGWMSGRGKAAPAPIPAHVENAPSITPD